MGGRSGEAVGLAVQVALRKDSSAGDVVDLGTQQQSRARQDGGRESLAVLAAGCVGRILL